MWEWILKIIGQIILSSAMGSLWNLIISKFQRSTETKLGIAETLVSGQKSILEKGKTANEVQNATNRLSDDAVVSELRAKWQRD